jgi:hypothetical protein
VWRTGAKPKASTTAATRDDELLLQGIEIEPNRPTQQHVEILEGYRRRVRADEGCQRRVRRGYVPRESNAPQVGVDVGTIVAAHPSSR